MRRLLVEVGVVLVILGILLAFRGYIVFYNRFIPLIVAGIGALIMILGVLMTFTSERASQVLSIASSALTVCALLLIILGFISAPLFFIKPWFYPFRESRNYVYGDQLTTENVEVNIVNDFGRISLTSWNKSSYLINFTAWFIVPPGKTISEVSLNFKPNVDVKKVGNKTIITIFVEAFKDYFVAADVKVILPVNAKVDVSLKVTTGEAVLRNMEMVYGHVKSTTGRVLIENVTAQNIDISTTTGEVKAILDAEKAFIKTTTGKAYLKIMGKVSGEYRVEVTTGKVEIHVPSTVGVLLYPSTTLGSVDYPSNWRKEALKIISPNYDVANVKVTIFAKTTTGSIEVVQG